MVCAPVRSIIPSLKLGDDLSVQRTNHALSLTCYCYWYFLIQRAEIILCVKLVADIVASVVWHCSGWAT